MPQGLPTDPDFLTDLHKMLVQNQGLRQEVNVRDWSCTRCDMLPVSSARSSDLEIACFAARKAKGASE